MSTLSPEISSSCTLLSDGEKAALTAHLSFTREDLFAVVSGLSAAQTTFKPAPDQWSIAENLEHLLLIEERVLGLIDRLPQAPPAPADRIASEIDAMILEQVPLRSGRIQTPPIVMPTGLLSASDAIEQLSTARGQTIDLAGSAPALRTHILPHPILGPLDGYQWLLAASAHCARHTAQIREIMADPAFPTV